MSCTDASRFTTWVSSIIEGINEDWVNDDRRTAQQRIIDHRADLRWCLNHTSSNDMTPTPTADSPTCWRAHLIELGHRELAAVLGRVTSQARTGRIDQNREDEMTVRVARERVAGYRSAMTAAGLDPDDLVLWEAGGNDPDRGRRAVVELLGTYPSLTGLLCFSDQLAIGACQAGQVIGRDVPQDLFIVGFDDVPRARTWDPPLTTVRQPLVEKGRAATELLLEQIDGASPRRIMLPIELVVRSSTAPRKTAS